MTYIDLLHFLVRPINLLQSPSGGPDYTIHKQSYYSLAKCVAAITITCRDTATSVVHRFVEELQQTRFDSQKIFSLLVVGEIGREM